MGFGPRRLRQPVFICALCALFFLNVLVHRFLAHICKVYYIMYKFIGIGLYLRLMKCVNNYNHKEEYDWRVIRITSLNGRMEISIVENKSANLNRTAGRRVWRRLRVLEAGMRRENGNTSVLDRIEAIHYKHRPREQP